MYGAAAMTPITPIQASRMAVVILKLFCSLLEQSMMIVSSPGPVKKGSRDGNDERLFMGSWSVNVAMFREDHHQRGEKKDCSAAES